ncbi:MAG TPA: hypothetical protein VJU18_05150 [Vicinamibacteria bacterium]|nr:hypothetical protein [Vicinamibacteria bacterium]
MTHQVFSGYCDIHRFGHGPRGCPVCSRERRQTDRKEERRVLKWSALALGPLVLLLAWLALPSGKPSDLRLDPSPYRAGIETLESVLFHGDVLTEDDRDLVARAAEALYRDLDTGPLRETPRGKLVEELRVFLYMTAFEAREVAQARLDLLPTRRRWETFRQATFLPAPWFLGSSQVLDAAQAKAAEPQPPRDAKRYREALDQLRSIANLVEFDNNQIPEGGTHATSREARAFAETLARAKPEVADLRERFPDFNQAPYGTDWLEAWKCMDYAASHIRQLTPPPGQGNVYRQSLGVLFSSLECAQSALDRLGV